ncbi:MAG TPA: hypothetical protein PKJ51_01575 [Methanothrix sp.]|jgi:hypothetical protein|nr:hypothetical protein [Methanothrix sp.]
MYSFFPVFSYFLQDAITEPVRVGILRDLADADLVDGLAVQVYRQSEEMEIVDQGFEDQYRLRIAYQYSVSVVSNISEAVSADAASGIVEILSPGSDVSVTYDGTLYNMYIDKVKDTVEFKNGFWHEVLTFTGFVYSRLI